MGAADSGRRVRLANRRVWGHCHRLQTCGGLRGRLGTDHGEPSAEALTKAWTVADDYVAAYEEWLVNLATENAGPGPQIPGVRFSELTRGFGVD